MCNSKCQKMDVCFQGVFYRAGTGLTDWLAEQSSIKINSIHSNDVCLWSCVMILFHHFKNHFNYMVQLQNPNYSYFHYISCLGLMLSLHWCCVRCYCKQSSNLTACARMKSTVTYCWGEWEEEEEEATCQLWRSTLPQWKIIHVGPASGSSVSASPSCSVTTVTWHFSMDLLACVFVFAFDGRPNTGTYCVTHRTLTCLMPRRHEEWDTSNL